ncbi:MAG: hypothetical protein IJZ04_00830 [Clostridia bacterium]|nr:hypothetical protein [Clostridia bacterium]
MKPQLILKGVFLATLASLLEALFLFVCSMIIVVGAELTTYSYGIVFLCLASALVYIFVISSTILLRIFVKKYNMSLVAHVKMSVTVILVFIFEFYFSNVIITTFGIDEIGIGSAILSMPFGGVCVSAIVISFVMLLNAYKKQKDNKTLVKSN